MDLFQLGEFTLRSGQKSEFRIDAPRGDGEAMYLIRADQALREIKEVLERMGV